MCPLLLDHLNLPSRYEQTLKPRQNHSLTSRFVWSVFFFVVLLTLWFGLRPFNFMAPNDVQVDTANSRAIFNQTLTKGTQQSRGLAFTSQAVTFNAGKGITFHLSLTPLRWPDGLCHIVYFYDGQDQAAFAINQWQDHLELFSRRPLSPKGYQEASVRNILQPGKPISLTITSSPDTTLVFVNSDLLRRLRGFTFLQNAENSTGQLLISNNTHGTQPWHGSIEVSAKLTPSLQPPENVVMFAKTFQGGDHGLGCGGYQICERKILAGTYC